MGFIEKILAEDEIIIRKIKLHWLNYAPVITWFLLGIYFSEKSELGFIIPISISFYLFLGVYFTEYVLTNKRIILKKGIISRYTEEQILKKVETVEFKQGILPRLFGTGSVQVTGTGNSIILFRYVVNPIGVRKIIDKTVNEYNLKNK
tara:strand:+ start:3757 stop:4200 length:444 start_codon:yes stop_codon:yes gene_type:complete